METLKATVHPASFKSLLMLFSLPSLSVGRPARASPALRGLGKTLASHRAWDRSCLIVSHARWRSCEWRDLLFSGAGDQVLGPLLQERRECPTGSRPTRPEISNETDLDGETGQNALHLKFKTQAFRSTAYQI